MVDQVYPLSNIGELVSRAVDYGLVSAVLSIPTSASTTSLAARNASALALSYTPAGLRKMVQLGLGLLPQPAVLHEGFFDLDHTAIPSRCNQNQHSASISC